MKKSLINKKEDAWIVFMTTYPPRECGIATFSYDLIESFDKIFSPREETKVISMEVDGLEFPKVNDPKVIYRISENNKEHYIESAKYLNSLEQVKLVSIQHEFGIFGKNDGENILLFLEELNKPVVVTFHTVLPEPSEHMLEIVKKIAIKAAMFVAMTETSKNFLHTVYGIDLDKIKVIPHGIHALPYSDSNKAKKELARLGLDKLGNLEGKKVISTFGFLNWGKGIEYAIEALPAIVKAFPETRYLVIGATHPVVLRREGDVYINELKRRAEALGVINYVHFYNSYLETKDLLKFLQATDIYLSLSQNPNQAVSGTLTYALGSGCPVISTPFMQAKEVVTKEVGVHIAFNNSESISHAVIDLLNDPDQLTSKSHAAYFRTRGMVWPNAALSYMKEFVHLSPELAKKEKALPLIDLSHIRKMTDDFGMLQFAILNEPNALSGYTLDDNARSLVAMVWEFDCKYVNNKHLDKKPLEIELAEIYLTFLERAARENGKFINYYDVDRKENHIRNNEENLEDSNARALWAIAEVYRSKVPDELRLRADELFRKQLVYHEKIASPRAAAFFIKAFAIRLSALNEGEDDKLKEMLVSNITFYADFLMSILKDNETEDWIWFEDKMTYSNAVLSESLFFAHKYTGYMHYLDAAKRTLAFLLFHSIEDNICKPIGQAGWFKRGGVKEPFDQQPEEVSTLVLALRTAAIITNDHNYIIDMQSIFNWFLGNNILGQVIYSHETGGSYDGLGDQYINLNQGAESTVSYLLARLAMEEDI